MPALTGQQKQFLRGLAHDLEPVIQVGHKGVTPSLIKELDSALSAHELIKVKLGRHVPEELTECATEIEEKTGSTVVQLIGKVLVVYRQAEDEEDRKIELPRKKRVTKKAAARKSE